MKILIIRHGESAAKVINAYGGWADFLLTKKGREEVRNVSEELSKLPYKFELILSSNLKRALSSSEIVSKKLKIPIVPLEYVKERNKYGVLSGMNRDEAKKKYPDQVSALANGDYVDGSERIEDMNERVKKAYKYIIDSGVNNLVLVTHTNFLRFFFRDIFNRVLVNTEDAGYILIEIDGSKCKVLLSKGIDISKE